MKHRVLGGLTVAVAMSVFGAPLPTQAQDSGDNSLSLDPEAEHHANVLSQTPESGLLTNSDSPVLEPSEPDSALLLQSSGSTDDILGTATVFPHALEAPQGHPAEPDTALSLQPPGSADPLETATVFSHALDSRQAATVYIRSIPVVTLVGGELETLSASLGTVAVASDAQPQHRAETVVSRLQELAANGDADTIVARWDSDDESFVVAWGEESLITLDSETILPDTTGNPGEDALQIANRLRRLLGDAPPLASIEGLPEPSASDTRVGIVTSTLTGMASWYGPGFHGRRSASGEVFNQNDLTAAHRTLPFGTRVRVTNVSTGQSVVVRINDRGPFSHGRVIDLSAAAATNIGLRASGVARVQLEVLSAE
ncbi:MULTISPECIES: septal ring lytic transglycosylase RlpA family protein [Cyanophyceae]|uniref:septal ring lytic transglycosylase RlpA family protein n=1 Tax=Cyanophyceae TaxID=3028117 RepID=UPI0016874F7A|nr:MULTISPECIES: septal ring lytic transglycosylase RlpA family protein [Cyanophyceae]MBD1914340.1 septal ring lytic transglycosylase RlpA family protein [Phormidium sp. FACHB-77]MBD2028676.1 septal ring lytic transglycosylase RlpA family protein [Phormidium sp. FACHB-322]MBD2053630.1 septal ring lytic transglycosylase RlpA family protein [Leptolyngbya sp. FACHB-60]